MTEDKEAKKEIVRKAYNELSKKTEIWPNKYNISRQLSKALETKFCLCSAYLMPRYK